MTGDVSPADRLLTAEPDAAGFARLLTDVAQADDFALFGLPAAFDVDGDALRRTFLAISRRIHPDIAAAGSPNAQRAVMQLSARVNRAFETLRNPIRRAEYLLQLRGGKSPADDKRVPQDVLAGAMMLREELEEAQQSGDQAALDAMREQVGRQALTAEERVAELARKLAAPTDEIRDALRLQLNAMKYIINLRSQL
ncbi:MAG: Fe-S protein assembly co-chaperone HscB [Phycisphaerae bacterium]